MATFNKVNSYVSDIHHKVHNLASDQLAVALTDTAPTATLTNYAGLTSPLASTNLSGTNPFYITTTSSTQTAGAYKLLLANLTLTATGAFGPFRYVAIYNTTAASQQLLGWIDVGTEISLSASQSYTIQFDQTAGAITGS